MAGIELVSGNYQVVAPKATAAKPFVVRVRDTTGAPLARVPVVVSTQCGLINGKATQGMETGNDGVISVTLADAKADHDRCYTSFRVQGTFFEAVFITQVYGGSSLPFPQRMVYYGTPVGGQPYWIDANLEPGGPFCSLSELSVLFSPFLDHGLPQLPGPATFLTPVMVFETKNCTPGSQLSFGHYATSAGARRYFLQGGEWREAPMRLANAPPSSSPFVSDTVVDGGLRDIDGVANGRVRMAVGLGTDPTPRYQDMWWGGTAENGWGMSIVQHRDALFTVIFAYDDQGSPVWYVMPEGAWDSARATYRGALYMPRGSPFWEYDVARFTPGSPVGEASIHFQGTDRAALTFTINGVTATKEVSRQDYGALTSPVMGNIGDMWWGGPSQNGWGVAVLQNLASLFSVWFTYDARGLPTWFVMPAGRWAASDTYEGRLYWPRGSAWLGRPYDPSQLQANDVGLYRLRFGPNGATLEYNVNDRTGSLPLTRQGF